MSYDRSRHSPLPGLCVVDNSLPLALAKTPLPFLIDTVNSEPIRHTKVCTHFMSCFAKMPYMVQNRPVVFCEREKYEFQTHTHAEIMNYEPGNYERIWDTVLLDNRCSYDEFQTHNFL
jgi:hypothetical protein